jgi:hypothetical protein
MNVSVLHQKFNKKRTYLE